MRERKLKRTKKKSAFQVEKGRVCGCRVAALVGVDERGQMVLPKETRQKADIGAGDKLALVTFERDGRVCCISLVKVEELAGMVKGLLGPMTKEILG